MLSMRTIYALRAAEYLARSTGKWVLVANIAAEQGIPKPYLETILLTLQRAQIVVSKRGMGGGYQLREAPSQILVSDLVEAVEGLLLKLPCLITPERHCTHCSNKDNCVAHTVLHRLERGLSEALSGVTLDQVLAQLKAPNAEGPANALVTHLNLA
jgi:Rrf2 family protein